MSVKTIVESIDKLSVLELAELVKTLEEKFGVSAAVPAVAAGVGPAAPATAGGATPAGEEKDSFDVILANAGANKIAVIKAVREIKPEFGLKEAKDLVDTAPKSVLEQAKKADAEAAKQKLEAAGAQVELK